MCTTHTFSVSLVPFRILATTIAALIVILQILVAHAIAFVIGKVFLVKATHIAQFVNDLHLNRVHVRERGNEIGRRGG
jgi:hypothetical protein